MYLLAGVTAAKVGMEEVMEEVRGGPHQPPQVMRAHRQQLILVVVEEEGVVQLMGQPEPGVLVVMAAQAC
jgi:hypothetical protein